MKVTGEVLLTVSTTYKTTVGNVDASVSVMMEPDTLHVNTSICPGVSRMAISLPQVSMYFNTSGNFVENRFSDVTIAPLGPSLYCFITSL